MFDRAEEMQVGAPRGAERWYLTDGVMNDGRIVARKFVGYFDSGAYTRLSSYAIIKAVGHLPGPYTIPNVYADVYCVFTNRTPATAMRGFGITGVDFAMEAHMDKVAEKVGMDPIELRILNAYRDGDMKAHRRLANNTALIECCQVAAEKANWRISEEARRQNSLTGGGGERAQLPNYTATDQNGRVEGVSTGSYARKASSTQPTPAPAQFQPPAQPQYQPAASAPRTSPSPPPPRQTAPAITSPTPQPPPQPPTTAGSATRKPMRFSSISGLRRR